MNSPSGTQREDAFSVVSTILNGNKTGFELSEESHQKAIERFVVVSLRGSPRLMLPTAQPLMKRAIVNFLGNRRAAYLMPRLVQSAARIGGPFSSIVSEVSLTSDSNAPCPLRELIADTVGRDDFQIAMRLSLSRPNPKAVVMAISDAGETLCYAKIGTEAMTNELVAHESSILEQFSTSNMPLIVPRQIYAGTWADAHQILITTPLQLTALRRDASVAHQAADALACQHLVTDTPLIDSEFWRNIIERTEEFNLDENDNILTKVAKIEQTWGARSFDFGASHGDWTRTNLGLIDGQVAALDWERFSKSAPRGIDIAHFAICENLVRPLGRAIEIDPVTVHVRQYLESADLARENAEPLITLALLEMVIRFKSAQKVGLRSKGSKFESALKTCLQYWTV